MRLQLGDNRRKAQCEEEEKKEEEDYLSQPSGHNHISPNPSKVTVREVLVRGGPWAEGRGGESGGRASRYLQDEKRGGG